MANAQQSPAKLEALNRAAKQRFMSTFEGAVFEDLHKFHHRHVIRFMRRDYMRAVLDWHLSTTLARSQLKSPEIASKVEKSMLGKVNEVKAHFEKLRNHAKMLAQSQELSLNQVTHPVVHEEKVVKHGPVSVQIVNTITLCEEYLDYIALLYTFGAIDATASNDASYDVRVKLGALSTSLRTHRVGMLGKLRESGIVRPGYDKAAVLALADAADQVEQVDQADGKQDAAPAVVTLVQPVVASANADSAQLEAVAA